MGFDFEALVGHLYVVGGRSISTQPPGMLVEVAPRRAARGRELDTIFVLVTPSGEATAPAAFYDQMAQVSAERYFNSSGSVTAGLRAVFTTLNQDLIDHNAAGKKQYEANILVAVLRDDELFLARVGADVALIRNQADSQPQPFPTEFSNDDALFGPPLGVHPIPDIKMSKYTINQGSRLLLADSRLADVHIDKLTVALNANDIAGVLSEYKDLLTSQITLMIAEFVPPEAPSPVPVKEGRSTSKSAQTPANPAPSAETTLTESSTPIDTPEPAPRGRRGNAARSQAQRGTGRIALVLAGAFDGINQMLDRIFPAPAEGQRSRLKASTLAGITVLVPVVIVILVVVVGIGGTEPTEFELCVGEANKAADSARAIPSNDVGTTLNSWNAVITVIDRCNDIRQGDPSLASVMREGQNIIDKLFQVERRQTQVVSSFRNAVLNQVVLQGLDLYVLDSQNQQVYRVSLEEDGHRAVANSQFPIPSMRLNASVSEFRVSNIIDIAWAEDITQIIALDDKGVLIQCSPRFLQTCQAQQLLAAERWVSPTHVTMWQGRLYILDPGANQVWRYDSTGGTYANAPIEYFVGDNRADIRNAVDFSIDTNGYVYMLSATGEITKWVSGQQSPFSFAGFPAGQEITSANAMFLNTDPIGQAIYIVSRQALTIYETSLAGSFSNSYRAFNEDDFASLSNVIADANLGIVYVLSGNSIFAFDRQAAAP
jgi:hypothetical protein